jgi:hypothetical protein
MEAGIQRIPGATGFYFQFGCDLFFLNFYFDRFEMYSSDGN